MVTNIETGEPEYIPIKDMKKDIEAVRASASLPLVSNNVSYHGKLYLDGGISDAIPIKRSIEDGNRRNVVIMTKEVGRLPGWTKTLQEADGISGEWRKSMIELLKAFLFGVVQGITEWLPISSTGHMILVNEFVKLNVSEEFWQTFLIVIQFGSILAVVVLFWDKIFPFGKKNNSDPVKKEGILSWCKKDIWIMWFKILVACIPAAVIGLLFDEVFERLFYNPVCVATALIVFGIAFIIVENRNKKRKPKINSLSEITYQTALIIGVFQLIAGVFPGTSRSGATIVGALLIGVSRTVAAEFTFFLAIPVMLGASLLKMVKFGFGFTGTELAILLVGMVTAFVVSVLVIKFLMGYIKKHDFKVFGWYRIVLGLLVLLYFGVFA